jgi:methylase of polypeptide subunit release factors
MKQLIKNIAGHFGFEISKAHSRESGFTIEGIKYEADSCSVGKTPEGEHAAQGAIRMIRERNLKNLNILDIGCGVGIIGLTIYTKLSSEGIVSEIVFSDINIFNLHSLKRTLKSNNLEHLLGKKIRCYLSDGLQHIPETEKFDIIIGNPPHFISKKDSEEWLSPGKLGTYDADWGFHKSFYNACSTLLKEKGEVWMFENSAADGDTFMPYIEANQKIKFVKQFPEPLNPRFYWMISQRIS